MKKVTLSVTIVALNEESNIRRCVGSIKNFVDEVVVVVDSRTIDKTAKIAGKLDAKVFIRKFSNFADQKNFALRRSLGDWILSLDADESIPPELGREIRKAITRKDVNGFLIPRRNIILGAEIKHTRWSPDKHVWLWKKSKGRWVGDVHEEVVVEGKVGELKHAKIHYQEETVKEFLDMINEYTEHEANERVSSGTKLSYFMFFYTPLLSFFRRYIYKKGFLDGWRGFVLSYMMAIYRMTTWVKVWEKSEATK
jgi:glycosyltransferase involved in cell wall biosynthesis